MVILNSYQIKINHYHHKQRPQRIDHRYNVNIKTQIGIFILAIFWQSWFVNVNGENYSPDLNRLSPVEATIKFSAPSDGLKIQMLDVKSLRYAVKFSPKTIENGQEAIELLFVTSTLSPQFNILTLGSSNQAHNQFTQKIKVPILTSELRKNNFSCENEISIQSNYIGRGLVRASILIGNGESSEIGFLDVRSTREDGTLSKIFKASAISLVVINFFNLGTQIQDENLKKLFKTPMISILGLMITLSGMPLVSWILGYFLFHDQLYYRFGAFLIGCCPAASASSFWVLLLKGDTELAVTLVLLSTVGAMITMPLWLYTLGNAITKDQYLIKVPYGTLVQTLFSLMLSLFVGYIIGKCSQKFAAFVRRVIKPFSFIILAFFIIFSSIVYWFIYRMFDWKMIALGLAISFLTYLLSAGCGWLVHRDFRQLITVSISATHKSSGIAFAVLLVALPDPDYYVAFVPCLAQVLATRSILYTVLIIRAIYNSRSSCLLFRSKSYDARDPIKTDVHPGLTEDQHDFSNHQNHCLE